MDQDSHSVSRIEILSIEPLKGQIHDMKYVHDKVVQLSGGRVSSLLKNERHEKTATTNGFL